MVSYLRPVQSAGFKTIFCRHALDSAHRAANYALRDVLQDHHVATFISDRRKGRKLAVEKPSSISSLMIDRLQEIETLAGVVNYSSRSKVVAAKKEARSLFLKQMPYLADPKEEKRLLQAYPYEPVYVSRKDGIGDKEGQCFENSLD